MRIGVDVDGVLTDLEKFQIEYGKKYFKKTDEEIDITKTEIEDIFHVTKEEAKKFWTKYFYKYCVSEKMKPDVVAAINKLNECGHKNIIITSRVNTTKEGFVGSLFRKMLTSKLKQSGVKYDEIYYCPGVDAASEKLQICKEQKIDLMIEDTLENAEKISEVCPVLLSNNSSNQTKQQNDRITRFSNGDELIEKIKATDLSVFGPLCVKKDPFKHRYNFVRNIGVPFFQSNFHPLIIDKEFIPEKGPVLLCGNHLHVWDQFPVICATKRQTHWMAKKEYFDGKMGMFFKQTGAISVDRFGNAKTAEQEAIDYLKDCGSAVGIFPEGTRNKLKKQDYEELYGMINPDMEYQEFYEKLKKHELLTSQVNKLKELYNNGTISIEQFYTCLCDINGCLNSLLQNGIVSETEYNDTLLLPFKFGAVSMAKKTDALIVPFAVNGHYEKKNDDLVVRFGEPMNVRNMDLEEANKLLRQKVLSLELQNINMKKK